MSDRRPVPPLIIEPVSDALAIFLHRDEFCPMDQAAMGWLVQRGVPVSNIASPWPVGAARVLFPQGGRYLPNQLGSFAYVFGIIGDRGLIDAAAWSPTTGEIGTRLGRAFALGQGQLYRDGWGATGAALPVWRSPVAWLRCSRCGIVIADPVLAAHALAGAVLKAEDSPHRRELDRRLGVPRPKIVLKGG